MNNLLSRVLFNVEQSREADLRTINEFGIPSEVLMENAGSAIAKDIEDKFQNILILCGTGNNGGDGFVIARYLSEKKQSTQITVYALMDENGCKTEECKENLALLKKIKNIKIIFHSDEQQLLGLGNDFDLIVDALLGTGNSNHSLKSPISRIVDWINQQSVKKYAVDIPTGLNADTGSVFDRAVKADKTFNLGTYKIGCFINEAREYCGQVKNIDIGIPEGIIENIHEKQRNLLLTAEYIDSKKPVKKHTVHKHNSGKVLVIAGSRQYGGAANLASRAAMRIGSGIVYLACPKSIKSIILRETPELIISEMDETEDGYIAESSLGKLMDLSASVDAVLIGCGLGQDMETQRLLEKFLPQNNKKTVIDADALNMLAKTDLMESMNTENWLLTPHLGEFSRLTGQATESIKSNLTMVREYSRKFRCNILLKSMPSLLAGVDGVLYVNSTGNEAVAKAGTGDVLAGFCAGLMAQGLSAVDAGCAGIFMAGQAADLYVKKYNFNSLLASDLLEEIRNIQ